LGKEFLLFQVLRDDFLSIVVRACWLVSFFFTPIYMFMLVFIVIFGPKKGVLTTYSNFWNFKYFEITRILVNFLNKNFSSTQVLNFYLLYRFQFTILTCRTTIYVLLFFWLFFFFFGESLLLILFNFTTVTDAIYSNYFFMFKTHTIFSIYTTSINLSAMIMFYIFFFLSCALIFLLNLRYTFNYSYLNNLWILDLFFFFVILFLFVNFYLIIFFLSCILFTIYQNYFYLNK
jgi:hypothetical protein